MGAAKDRGGPRLKAGWSFGIGLAYGIFAIVILGRLVFAAEERVDHEPLPDLVFDTATRSLLSSREANRIALGARSLRCEIRIEIERPTEGSFAMYCPASRLELAALPLDPARPSQIWVRPIGEAWRSLPPWRAPPYAIASHEGALFALTLSQGNEPTRGGDLLLLRSGASVWETLPAPPELDAEGALLPLSATEAVVFEPGGTTWILGAGRAPEGLVPDVLQPQARRHSRAGPEGAPFIGGQTAHLSRDRRRVLLTDRLYYSAPRRRLGLAIPLGLVLLLLVIGAPLLLRRVASPRWQVAAAGALLGAILAPVVGMGTLWLLANNLPY